MSVVDNCVSCRSLCGRLLAKVRMVQLWDAQMRASLN